MREKILNRIVLIMAIGLFVSGATVAVVQAQEGEPNGSEESATPVSIGETIDGSIDSADDVDYYSFVASQGQTITLEGTNTGGLGPDESMYIEFPQQDSVGIEEPGANGTASMTVFDTGTYFVKVRGLQESTASYEFTLTTPESGGQEEEPNGNRGTAKSISVGETVAGDLDTPGDVDVYSFVVSQGQTITIEGTSTGGLGPEGRCTLEFHSEALY